MLNQNMVSEATRLTRAGQLVEATALLQRMFRGESAPEPSGSTARAVPARLELPTIDVKAMLFARGRVKVRRPASGRCSCWESARWRR